MARSWARSLASLTVLAAVTAYVAAIAPVASAAGESCAGKPATLVVDSNATTSGTDGDDVVVITSPDVTFFDALAGDDTVCAGPGNTTVLGGPGDDSIYGEGGKDLLFGGTGDDHVYGGLGNDEVSGGDPDQSGAAGSQDIDVVDGGPGDDLAFDTSSNERLIGGSGQDTLTLNVYDENDPELCDGPPPATPTPVLSVGDHTVTGLGSDTFTSFRAYLGGAYHDTLIGGPGPDRFTDDICGDATMDGENGDDTIVSDSCGATVQGGRGADRITLDSQEGRGTFRGGAGRDHLVIGSGDDFTCGTPGGAAVYGGPGSDTVEVPGVVAPQFTRIDLHRGVAVADGTTTALTGVENVLVGANQDQPSALRIVGTAGPNRLVGGSGPTIIHGRQGRDVLIGGPGHDTVYGGTGYDVCMAEVTYECEAHGERPTGTRDLRTRDRHLGLRRADH